MFAIIFTRFTYLKMWFLQMIHFSSCDFLFLLNSPVSTRYLHMLCLFKDVIFFHCDSFSLMCDLFFGDTRKCIATPLFSRDCLATWFISVHMWHVGVLATWLFSDHVVRLSYDSFIFTCDGLTTRFIYVYMLFHARFILCRTSSFIFHAWFSNRNNNILFTCNFGS